jgi:hypothetical protein
MQAPAAQKNDSGEGQDLRLYQKAAEVAYQYARNKADQEKEETSSEQNKNEGEDLE